MNPSPSSRSLPRLWLRLLTFRASSDDYQSLGARRLLPGLLACWIVGAGRYWDDSKASLLQQTGLGSVAYVFVLAGILWIIVKPLEPERIRYIGLLCFIAMTAPPAALYAIPVERWMPLEAANQMNLGALGVVALWRLALWIHYLSRFASFYGGGLFVAATMPLAIIFISLTSLNLHHVVFDIMGGIRDADQTSQDAAFGALFVLSILSVPLSLVAAVGWIAMVIRSGLRRNDTQSS